MSTSDMADHRRSFPIGLVVLGVAAVTVIAMAGVQTISSIIAPAFFGLTMVVTARPLIVWLRKYLHLPGWLATLLMLLAVYLILLGIIGGIAYGVAETGTLLAREEYRETYQQMYTDSLAWLSSLGVDVSNFEQYLSGIDFNQILSVVSGAANMLTSGTSQAVLFVVITAFMGFDTINVRGRTESLREAAPYLTDALTGFTTQVRKYWIVSTVFGAIVAIGDGIALTVMDVPLAWTFALFAFVTNYIPNIGFFIGLIPPALVGLLDGGVSTMIWIIVVYTVINNGFQTFIQPKVTGDAVGLNSTVTFVSLVFWTSIVGPLGSILAVPLTLFAKAVLIDSDPRTKVFAVFLQSGDKKVTGTQAELDAADRMRAERRGRNARREPSGEDGAEDLAGSRHKSGEITVGELRRARAGSGGSHPIAPTTQRTSVDGAGTAGATGSAASRGTHPGTHPSDDAGRAGHAGDAGRGGRSGGAGTAGDTRPVRVQPRREGDAAGGATVDDRAAAGAGPGAEEPAGTGRSDARGPRWTDAQRRDARGPGGTEPGNDAPDAPDDDAQQ
ncbi:AI-2E family transporter [Georgenia sp. Z1344]|uniref:AI-2E family transporter n=1 Tax=Georgenia sp. Z1344 TaxID=3416706 RepID=UPI003CE7CBC7